MSTLQYNGIEFSYVKMLTFDQEAVFDPSGTDYLYDHITIICEAVVALQPSVVPGAQALCEPADLIDGDVSGTIVRIRGLLETPRMYLLFTNNCPESEDNLTPEPLIQVQGVNIAGSSAPEGTMFDVKNGPIPKVLTIQKFGGCSVFNVVFQIQTWILECPTLPAVLSHRWTEQMSFDRTFAVTYQRSGRLIVRSTTPTGSGTASADSIGRPQTYVPLRLGFRREDGEYVCSDDGLALTYRVTDKQLFRTFPSPAVDGSGTYTESTGTGASIRKAAVRLKLIGPVDGSQSVLLIVAVIVAMQKFPGIVNQQALANAIANARKLAEAEAARAVAAIPKANAEKDGLIGLLIPGVQDAANAKAVRDRILAKAEAFIAAKKAELSCIILRASIGYDLFENSVTVEIEAQLPPAKKLNVGLPFPIGAFFTATPGTSTYANGGGLNSASGRMPIPSGIYGQTPGNYSSQPTRAMQMLAAALGVPCGDVQSTLTSQNSIAGVAVGANANALAAASDGQQPTGFNQDSGLYSDYEMSAHYRERQNILQSPNATPAGGPKVSSIVQWADPIGDVVLSFKATRIGGIPTIPSKEMKDPNLVYVDSQISPNPPTLRGDGVSEEFTISGKYYYAVIDQSKLVMRTGLYPWMASEYAESTKIPDSIFSPNIMNPTGGGTSGSVSVSMSAGSGSASPGVGGSPGGG